MTDHVLPAKPSSRVVWGSSRDCPCPQRAYGVMWDTDELTGNANSRMSWLKAQGACLA